MRFHAKAISYAASVLVLMPALLLYAGETPKSLTSADKVEEASSSSASPAPATPLPMAPVEAWTPPASPHARGANRGTPIIELFLGYSYLRAVPQLEEGNRMMWLNGGSTSLALNFNRYLGIVGDFGGFDDSKVRLTGSGVNPTVEADSSGTAYTFLVGPRLSFRHNERITPFVQALFGGINASKVTLNGCKGPICRVLPDDTAFAMTAGGGLDLRVRRHLALRIIQAEYLMTNFEDVNTGKNKLQNDMRLSSGIVFRFGGSGVHAPPPSPLAYSCSVNPTAVFAGDPIVVTGTAENLSPTLTATYTWSADGGTVTGTSDRAKIDTTGVAPGTYALKGHVSEGDKPGQMADCTAPYQVKAAAPPTVSCSANPTSVLSGQSSTITAIGVSPENRPLTYSYNATSGSVTGSGTTASLATVSAFIGTVTVSCNATDDKGQLASATTEVVVTAPAAPPMPVTSLLCSIDFDRDPRRPSRVNNEAKACLDQVALSLQHSSDAKVALTGNASVSEKSNAKLAAERAVHTKAYLVDEKGIDSSRITTYTGSVDAKTVTTTLIPAGATINASGIVAVDESSFAEHKTAHAKRVPR